MKREPASRGSLQINDRSRREVLIFRRAWRIKVLHSNETQILVAGKSKGSSEYISASEIGACAYCAYQHHLRGKYGDSGNVKKRLKFGNHAHQRFNKKHRKHGLGRWLGIAVLLIALLVVVKSL